MPKYIVEETQLCYVDWFYKVEADDEQTAKDQVSDGDHSPIGHFVGDASSFASPTTQIITDKNFGFQHKSK